VDNYLTVLTAQTGLYSAQLALVQARLARLTNLVDLYQFLGGGWIEHTGDAPPPPEDVGSIASPSPSPWSLLKTGELGRTIKANQQ
jgi:multidrug efflux system outer membrane protein